MVVDNDSLEVYGLNPLALECAAVYQFVQHNQYWGRGWMATRTRSGLVCTRSYMLVGVTRRGSTKVETFNAEDS